MQKLIWVTVLAVLYIAIVTIVGQIVGFLGGFLFATGALVTFIAYWCYLDQEVKTDQVGVITEGGRPITGRLLGGRYFVMVGVQVLHTFPRWIQGEYNPEPEQTTGEEPHVFTAQLPEVIFPGKPQPNGRASDNPLERRLAAKPDIGLLLEIVDPARLLQNAGSVEIAINFLCEPIGQHLQEQALAMRTFAVALEQLPAMQTNLLALPALVHEVTHLGFRLQGLSIEKLGLSEDIEEALNAAVKTAADKEGGITKAETAGITAEKLQDARTKGLSERVAKLVAQGVSPNLAAGIARDEAYAESIRESGLQTLVTGGGATGINLNLDGNKKPADTKKKGGH